MKDIRVSLARVAALALRRVAVEYGVWTAKDDESGRVVTRDLGRFLKFEDAARAAKRAAGSPRGKFQKKGVDLYIAGPLLTAWVEKI